MPEYKRLWVFTYIFFGWIGVCGSCVLIAEGILAKPGEDMLAQPRLWWQVPLATGLIAVTVDLLIDPVAVVIGYWIWNVQGNVYYGIPLLNFVGWFVLMFLAPLAWIVIAKRRGWGYAKKGLASVAALVPLFACAVLLSVALNSAVAALGLQ